MTRIVLPDEIDQLLVDANVLGGSKRPYDVEKQRLPRDRGWLVQVTYDVKTGVMVKTIDDKDWELEQEFLAQCMVYDADVAIDRDAVVELLTETRDRAIARSVSLEHAGPAQVNFDVCPECRGSGHLPGPVKTRTAPLRTGEPAHQEDWTRRPWTWTGRREFKEPDRIAPAVLEKIAASNARAEAGEVRPWRVRAEDHDPTNVPEVTIDDWEREGGDRSQLVDGAVPVFNYIYDGEWVTRKPSVWRRFIPAD